MSLPTESLAGKHDLKLVSEDASEVILATAGYDHTIKFWQAHTGACVLTLQHPDSHVNAMEISPDGQVMLLLHSCKYSTNTFSFVDWENQMLSLHYILTFNSFWLHAAISTYACSR